MAKFSDDGTVPRTWDPETNEVVFNVPELPADAELAELADLIDALVELGLVTVAEE